MPSALWLLLLGIGMGLVLRWSSRQLDPRVESLRQFAMRHHLKIQESGETLRIVGGYGGRGFSLSYLPGKPSTLLLGVDCAAPDRDAPSVQDQTLLSRWTNPPDHLFKVERLEALVEEMVAIAEEQEIGHPPLPETD